MVKKMKFAWGLSPGKVGESKGFDEGEGEVRVGWLGWTQSVACLLGTAVTFRFLRKEDDCRPDAAAARR